MSPASLQLVRKHVLNLGFRVLATSQFTGTLKPQLQILTMRRASSRNIEAPSRPIIIPSMACRRDAEIGIAIFPIRSVSPLKRGPNDVAIVPSLDWSVWGGTIT